MVISFNPYSAEYAIYCEFQINFPTRTFITKDTQTVIMICQLVPKPAIVFESGYIQAQQDKDSFKGHTLEKTPKIGPFVLIAPSHLTAEYTIMYVRHTSKIN